ncbi:putative membrane protein [Pseudoalteromonas translucida]|uniref:Membrane protein n=1 Tax=Pseudoalteromonas translucida (strain TAC 125) TaxID=326442 RepID=Q3IEV0_PSET1|nr:putative membrane protein [Pseudoalteromonas translucida]
MLFTAQSAVSATSNNSWRLSCNNLINTTLFSYFVIIFANNTHLV